MSPSAGHTEGRILSLVLSESKVLWTGGADGTIRSWNAETTDSLPLILKGHAGSVLSLALNGDENLWSGGSDQTLRMWDIADDFEGSDRNVKIVSGHLGSIRSLMFSNHNNNKTLYSGGSDAHVGATDVNNDEFILTLWKGHTDIVSCLAEEKGEGPHRIFSGSYDHTVRAWDSGSGRTLWIFQGNHQHIITSVVPFGSNPWVMSSSKNGVLNIWKIPENDDEGSSTTILPLFASLELPGGNYGKLCEDGEKQENTVHRLR